MTPLDQSTINQAHEIFAKQTNGRVWTLIAKPDRTVDETAEMIQAAYASLYHWRFAGTAVHQQRGEWLLAHTYTLLNETALALKHAQRCFELTKEHRDQMQDFDIAYAFEGMARAFALNGINNEAKKYLIQAQAAGEQIADTEDKQIFQTDLDNGDWFGIR